MTYDQVSKQIEQLSYRDKFRLAQLLIQLARKEEEEAHPERRHTTTQTAKLDSELIEYVADRLRKLKPSKKEKLFNSIGAMFQFQGGISDRDKERIFSELHRRGTSTLETITRAFMEPRFGHNLSRVQVHHDARAAQSANYVNARAYNVGNDIVFGRGEYAPETAEGKSLIAHELAHVVQQRNSISSAPSLRRAAKKAKTSAGEFVADPYAAVTRHGAGDVIVGYGADITIKFKASEGVDAEKIGFVQTALSVKDDKVVNKYEGKGKVGESRMIPPGKAGAGVHIDELPAVRTPLYGMYGNRGDDLANPEPAKSLTEIGYHYTDASKKLHNRDAMMHDSPYLGSGDIYTEADDVMNGEWHQHFETTALAISGNQQGTFYGSVEWGWTKSVADLKPNLLEFKTKSENVPSSIFMEAAKLWNVSVTTDQKDSIDLPVDVHITSESASLWDSPDQRKKITTLTKDTPLGRIAKVDPKRRTWWASVIVKGGPNVGANWNSLVRICVLVFLW